MVLRRRPEQSVADPIGGRAPGLRIGVTDEFIERSRSVDHRNEPVGLDPNEDAVSLQFRADASWRCE